MSDATKDPGKPGVQSVLAQCNVGVQDINVLSNPQAGAGVNNRAIKGDEALGHILDNIPVLSGNLSSGS